MKTYYITFPSYSPRAKKYIEISANDELQVLKWLRIEYPTELETKVTEAKYAKLMMMEYKGLTEHRKVIVGFDSKYANGLEAHKKHVNKSGSIPLILLMTGEDPVKKPGAKWETESPERFGFSVGVRSDNSFESVKPKLIDAAHSSLIIPLD